MNPWPHQLQGVQQVLDALAAGVRRVCLQAPTGAGKTLMMEMVARHIIDRGNKVAIYSNRKMLIDQLSDDFQAAGVGHGVRAAGHEDERDLHALQICSIQTEHTRVVRKGTWATLHAAGAGDLAIIDEGHLHTGDQAQEIRRRHLVSGGATLDVSATPFGLGGCCDQLVQAGTMSELRACGALLPAMCFAPDEPDLKALRKMREGQDPTEAVNRQAMMTPSIWGRVSKWFEITNPEHKPSILFAPGVRESLWFAEQFSKRGIPAAHIDGEEVWLDGKLYRSDREARRAVLEGSRDGRVVVICNRFVMREGVNCPWLAHGIFATVFGSIQSYIQAGGRLLRAHPSLAQVTIQDHGGAWHRFGSLNADRIWSLNDTAEMTTCQRADRMRRRQEPEPFRCPQCARVWTRGTVCHPAHGGCGYVLQPGVKRSRPVVSVDGELRLVQGDIYKPRRISTASNGPQLWERMYHRSRTETGQRTFRAAAALFAMENRWGWPNPSWPLMPIDADDWFRLVRDVPIDRLVPKPVTV